MYGSTRVVRLLPCPRAVFYSLKGKSASGSNMDFRSDFETDSTDLLR